MGKKKEVIENKVKIVELKVSMYCNACERSVAKVISKCKGVEKFITDMKEQRVVVTGPVDPLEVMKKLTKKTGKRVEIVSKNEDQNDDDSDKLVIMHQFALQTDSSINTQTIMMFSDDNPNACLVM